MVVTGYKRQYTVCMRSRLIAQLPKPVEQDLARLGMLIRESRIARGLTQAALAARLQISPTTVRAAEQGDPAVATGILATILWLLGIGPLSEALAARREVWELPGAKRKRRAPATKAIDDF